MPQAWGLANITGFSNAPAALSWGNQVIGLVELRGDAVEAAVLAKRMNYAVALAAPQEGGKCLVGVFYPGSQGASVKVPTAAGWEQRLAAVRLAIGPKSLCTVVCLYGHTNPTAEQKAGLGEQICMLLEYHAESGKGPMVIMGDFNMEESQLSSLTLARRAGWRDLGTGGTCLTANSAAARRIDMVWASSAFAGRAGSVTVDWSKGLPVHAVQTFQVQTGAPRALPHWQLGDTGPEEQEGSFSNEVWAQFFDPWRGEWKEALAGQDVDEAWRLLEENLVRSHGVHSGGFRNPKGRVVVKLEDAPQDPHSGQAYSHELRVVQHRKRVLQQLLACAGKPGREEVRKQLRHVLCCDPKAEWAAWGLVEAPREILEQLVEAARGEEDEALVETGRRRREAWQAWCRTEAKGSMRRLYRYVKQGPACMMQLGALESTDGEVLTGKAALLQASENAWWPLWQPGPRGQAREPEFRHYPALPLRALEGTRLEQAAWRCSESKAPGMDGWTLKRMKQWPSAVWRAVADMLQVVEISGRWPAALKGGLICLLPKNGVQASAQNPLEARPVVLLAQLYRIWAAVRAQDLARWIAHHGLQPTPAGRVAAAEELALLAAGLLEEAEARNQSAAILALDLSKAYDRIPLMVIEELVRTSGLAPEIGRPMLDMARGPRRIKVLDVVGELRDPESGLVPGCPMATYVMSLLLLRWRQGVAANAPVGRQPAILRCWVDDSTAGDTGESRSVVTVVSGLRQMELLAASDGLVVNKTKSAVAATPASHRKDLEELLQARQGWPEGLVLIVSDVDIGEDIKQAVCEQLEAVEAQVSVKTHDRVTWQNAGFASVLVYLSGPGVAPTVVQVIEAGQGAVLRGGPGGWALAQLIHARQCLKEHAAWPRIAVPVLPALKDLGVAIGSGRAGRDLQQQRLHELVRRTQLVARVGVPYPRRERLVAGSALPAGLFGCASQPPDADTLDAARRHVLYALHRGSRFCQLSLFFTVAVGTWRVDPAAVWICKAIDAARVIGTALGRGALEVMIASNGDGPVGGLIKVLKWVKAHLRGTRLCVEGREGPCLLEGTRRELRDFALTALRTRDLAFASRRAGQSELVRADILECKRVLKKLPAQGLQEAARSVATGDVVTRQQSRHWQGHDGRCLCGEGRETVTHFLWRCPHTWPARNAAAGANQVQVEHLPACQQKLAIPVVDVELERWSNQWSPMYHQSGDWKASRIFTDASSHFPKDARLRVVGWAAVAWTKLPGEVSERWHCMCGTLPPGSTVAQGEAIAVVQALARAAAGGTILTDCWGVQCLWEKARAGAVDDGGPLFQHQKAFHGAHMAGTEVEVQWLPAHRSFEECCREGLSFQDWVGNGMADALAKWAAGQGEPTPAIVQARAVQRLVNEQVLRVAGTVLLRRLQARPRAAGGGAVKATKRKAPALPRRLRATKRARRTVPSPPQVGPQVGPQLGDLLQWKVRAMCSADRARELVWCSAAPEEGLHQLAPLGPWPAVASQKAQNGRLCWQWVCGRCPARASDSSRALELLRKPCRAGGGLAMRRVIHCWEGDPGAPHCRRCGLVCLNGRQLAASEQHCPVFECQRNGEVWLQGEASLRNEMGRLHGFRRWCEASTVHVAEEGQAGAAAQAAGAAAPASQREVAVGVLAPVRFHQVVKLGRTWWCLQCFHVAEAGVGAFRRDRCLGAASLEAAPAHLCSAVKLFGPWAGLKGPAQARLALLLDVCGAGGPAGPPQWWSRAR